MTPLCANIKLVDCTDIHMMASIVGHEGVQGWRCPNCSYWRHLTDDEAAAWIEDWEEQQDAAMWDSLAEPVERSFCDFYEPHDAHSYRAINHNIYSCPGITAEEIAEMDARANELCEHMMSASLCVGPSHYPMDM